MSDGYTREEFRDWADNEGGLYELVAYHGIDISEFDQSDTEFIEALRAFEAHAKSFAKAELVLAALIGY